MALGESPHLATYLRCLTQLSERLAVDGAPIDYDRRRTFCGRAMLLDRTEWDKLALHSGIKKGQDKMFLDARRYLWELLTGGNLEHAPDEIKLTAGRASAYINFALRVPAVAVERLRGRAEQIVLEQGWNEPLEWSPPREWVDISTLPGLEPADIDADGVMNSLLAGRNMNAVAADFDIPLDAVRWVLKNNRAKPSYRELDKRYAMVSKLVDPDGPGPAELRRRLGAGESVTTIAETMKVNRKLVIEACGHLDLKVPPVGRRFTHQIDHKWLKEQYLAGKTTYELAASTGASVGAIAARLKSMEVELRKPGGAGHATRLRGGAGYREPIASALRSEAAEQRLRRFVVVLGNRNFANAGRTLGVTASSLSTQMYLLERDCGGPLLVRSSRGQVPLAPTPLGETLRRQARRYLSTRCTSSPTPGARGANPPCRGNPDPGNEQAVGNLKGQGLTGNEVPQGRPSDRRG
ncbi:MAG TPA: LysR family transcriptional regulator [Acidimicrobiales bacterium]|nr:LysR family transcriptional regulator [Acidimicrobiales bacterium]